MARPGWFCPAVQCVSDPRGRALMKGIAATPPRSSAAGDTTQTLTGRGPPHGEEPAHNIRGQ
jgi:hypothetical protein